MKDTKGAFTYYRLDNGIFSSNTYLLWDETGECAVIDAGNTPESINTAVENYSLGVKYIILTHAHYDHIYYLDELRTIYQDACVVCHEEENDSFVNPYKNGSLLFGSAKRFKSADRTVKDGDILYLGKDPIKFIHTPGHTEGGLCVLADRFLFTGDTLFYRSYGRTDLSGGSDDKMAGSLDRLYGMDSSLIVFPGHGTFTTIGDESENTFFTGG